MLSRYSSRPFPPYSYVPRHAPHPVSDPAGHMHGRQHEPAFPLMPTSWQANEEYLYGVDLFNHGYYWESHEAWESLWHAAGRAGEVAEFLKGLIKLAAACVKAREGNPRGVERHAARAMELLSGMTGESFCGVSIQQITSFAQELHDSAADYAAANPERNLAMLIELPLPLR